MAATWEFACCEGGRRDGRGGAIGVGWNPMSGIFEMPSFFVADSLARPLKFSIAVSAMTTKISRRNLLAEAGHQRDTDKVGFRPNLHLLHDAGPLILQRVVAGAKSARDFFEGLAAYKKIQNLPLAIGERCDPLGIRRRLVGHFAPLGLVSRPLNRKLQSANQQRGVRLPFD